MSENRKDGLIISAIEATEAITRDGVILRERENIEAEIGRDENIEKNQKEETIERD